jgi:retron-type reverse transcriptase
MKRADNLYEQILDPDNLRLAFIKAKKGKEQKPDVYQYSKHLNENLNDLRQQLITGNFNLGNYHFFTIYEPKERLICAAPFSERVLHHAIINICHEVFERFQIRHSYATRIGKGQYAALDYAAACQKKYPWFCKLDIRKYFDSIGHETLYNLLCRCFKDERLLSLFDQIIKSYKTSPGKGLPIGNLTSQYFANFYLAVADHYLLEKIQIPAYVRYMDDMVLWHADKNELLEKRNGFVFFISQSLGLQVKPACLNSSVKGLPFLGYVLFEETIRLNKNSKKRFLSKCKNYYCRLQSGIWNQKEFARHVTPLVAFTQYANAQQFRRQHFAKMEAG